MRELWEETPCEHGNVRMHNYEERALFPGCPGGSRRELTINYEAGAKRLNELLIEKDPAPYQLTVEVVAAALSELEESDE